jgi:hypothetical protein
VLLILGGFSLYPIVISVFGSQEDAVGSPLQVDETLVQLINNTLLQDEVTPMNTTLVVCPDNEGSLVPAVAGFLSCIVALLASFFEVLLDMPCSCSHWRKQNNPVQLVDLESQADRSKAKILKADHFKILLVCSRT